MGQEDQKTMSWPRLILGWARLLAIAAVVIALGLVFFSGFGIGEQIETTETMSTADYVGYGIFLAILGILSMIVGLSVYGVMAATQCLTFDYTRSVWKAYNVRRWIANNIVGVMFGGGIAWMIGSVLVPLLMFVGVSNELALIGFLVPFVVIILIHKSVLIWMPTARPLILKRMKAMGYKPGDEAGGYLVGYSDPDEKSGGMRFMQPLADTIGFLWLSPDGLHYIGDSKRLDLPKSHIVSVQRYSSSKAWTSYFGGRDVILDCQSPDGGQGYRLRLHPYTNSWTMPAYVRELDRMAARLEQWLEEPSDITDKPDQEQDVSETPAVT